MMRRCRACGGPIPPSTPGNVAELVCPACVTRSVLELNRGRRALGLPSPHPPAVQDRIDRDLGEVGPRQGIRCRECRRVYLLQKPPVAGLMRVCPFCFAETPLHSTICLPEEVSLPWGAHDPPLTSLYSGRVLEHLTQRWMHQQTGSDLRLPEPWAETVARTCADLPGQDNLAVAQEVVRRLDGSPYWGAFAQRAVPTLEVARRVLGEVRRCRPLEGEGGDGEAEGEANRPE